MRYIPVFNKRIGVFLLQALFFVALGYYFFYQVVQSDSVLQVNNKVYVFEKSILPLAPGESPKLFFSDLSHAPKEGWSKNEPSKGAAVTIWGRGFGETRNDSYVTVNGIALTKDSDYAEWNADSYDVFFLKRITFWLNEECEEGEGTILITVGGKTSQEIPFHVIQGNIYFVDKDASAKGNGTLENPWSNPNLAVKTLRPGDILYFREATTVYGDKYFTGRQNFYLIKNNTVDGTVNAPIALVSYPGETVTIDALENGKLRNLDANFVLARDYWTISKFRLRALVGCLHLGANNGTRGHGIRAIGNDCMGCQVYVSGTAPITTFASNITVLGNSSHGGKTKKKLDHAIYISGNPSKQEGVELGWNYIYDNNYAAGPMVVINHQRNRIPLDKSCKRHDIHHNVIDCSTHGGRGIGIYSMSWGNQPGEVQPERAFIYNNILLGAGWLSESTGAAMYCLNGKASFLNNTLVNCQRYAMTLGGDDVLSIVVKNNIFHMSKGTGYFYIVPGSKELTFDSNLYYGLGSGPSQDVHKINAEPSLNKHIIPMTGGPEVDKGKKISEIVDDFWGTSRPKNQACDIGACEYGPAVGKENE